MYFIVKIRTCEELIKNHFRFKMLCWFSKYDMLIFKYRLHPLLCRVELWHSSTLFWIDYWTGIHSTQARSTFSSLQTETVPEVLTGLKVRGSFSHTLKSKTTEGNQHNTLYSIFYPVHFHHKLAVLTVSNNNLCQGELLTFAPFNKAASACGSLRASFLSVPSI